MSAVGLTAGDELLDLITTRVLERVQPEKQVYTIDGLAEYLKVTPKVVRGMLDNGLPRHQEGRRYYIVFSEYLDWLKRR